MLLYRPLSCLAGTAGQRPIRPHGRALCTHPGTGTALSFSQQPRRSEP